MSVGRLWPSVSLTGTCFRDGTEAWLGPQSLRVAWAFSHYSSWLPPWISAEQGRNHSLFFLWSSIGYHIPLLLPSAIGHTDRPWYSIGEIIQGLHKLAGIFGDSLGGGHLTVTMARGPVSCNLLSVLTLEQSCLDLFSIFYSLTIFYF